MLGFGIFKIGVVEKKLDFQGLDVVYMVNLNFLTPPKFFLRGQIKILRALLYTNMTSRNPFPPSKLQKSAKKLDVVDIKFRLTISTTSKFLTPPKIFL